MQTKLRAATLAGIMLLLPGAASSGRAQTVEPQATSGTIGRIAKFVTATDLGNSLMFEKNNLIGIATSAPTSRLDIRAQNALQLWGVQPYLTFRDSNAGNIRHRIRSLSGGLSLQGEDFLNNSNPRGFVHVDRDGRVGFGTANPQRTIQIGPGVDPMFTIEPSDASPNAGYIRFGDGTGWQLHIGRSRQGSGGPLTTGTTGAIMTIKDNSASGIGGTVIFKGAVQVDSLYGSGASPTPVCRNSLNLLSFCSSSRRYKTDIKPFSGGLQLINRLQPVSFIWKADQQPDIGLIAEDVAKVDPRLTFKNDDGLVEGVNYSQLTTALIDAIKEQQGELQRQRAMIEQLQSALAHLEDVNRQPTALPPAP